MKQESDETIASRDQRRRIERRDKAVRDLGVAVAATAAALLTQEAISPGAPSAPSLLLIACIVGLAGFLRDSDRISGGNVLLLGMALFGGFSGIYLMWIEPDATSGTLDQAAAVIWATTLATAALSRYANTVPVPAGFSATWIAPTLARRIAIAAFGAGVAGSALLPALQPVPDSLLFLAVLFQAIALISLRSVRDANHAVLDVTLLTVLGSGYLFLTFEGGGRLLLGSLFLAAWIAGSLLSGKRWQKYAVLAALPLLLAAAGLLRSATGPDREIWSAGLQAPAGTQEVISDGVGLGSLLTPITDFETLLWLDETQSSVAFPRRYGATYVEAAMAPIPRLLWAGKPEGLGKLVVGSVEPRHAATDHSTAIGIWGEGYINFHWPGAVAAAPVLVWLLAAGSGWTARQITRRKDPSYSTVLLAIVASTMASLPDLVWAGLHAAVSRGGIRLLLLLPLAIVTLQRIPNDTSSATTPVALLDQEKRTSEF